MEERKKKKKNYEHKAVFNYHLGVFAASREGLRVDAARVQRHNSVFTILRAFPRRKGKALWKENCLSRGRISLFVLLATEQLPEYAFESKKCNVFRRIKLYILDHLKKLYFHLVLLSRSTHIFQRWNRSFWNDVIFHVNVFRAYSKTKEQNTIICHFLQESAFKIQYIVDQFHITKIIFLFASEAKSCFYHRVQNFLNTYYQYLYGVWTINLNFD